MLLKTSKGYRRGPVRLMERGFLRASRRFLKKTKKKTEINKLPDLFWRSKRAAMEDARSLKMDSESFSTVTFTPWLRIIGLLLEFLECFRGLTDWQKFRQSKWQERHHAKLSRGPWRTWFWAYGTPHRYYFGYTCNWLSDKRYYGTCRCSWEWKRR